MTMDVGTVTLLMFGLFCILLALGLPISFCMGGTAVIFALWLWGFGGTYVAPLRTWGAIMSTSWIAVPEFILMGCILERAGLADALFEVVYRWMGGFPGGLAIGVIVICALIGAMSAVAGAAAVALGIIATPSLLKRGYDKKMALGVVMGGATLCILIPPSITMIIYAIYAEQSVGQLFLAGIIPGLMMATIFIGYIIYKGWRHPETMPPIPKEERYNLKQKLAVSWGILPTLFLIMVVLGSIFTGIATPTEAAAFGVVGALVAAALMRRFSWTMLKTAAARAIHTNAAIFWIIVGAGIFAGVYQAIGVTPAYAINLINELNLSKWAVVGLIVVLGFVAGMFGAELIIIIVFVPVFAPLLVTFGFPSLWLGIVMVLLSMTGYLTPPYGLCLFYMTAVAPKGYGITTEDIYSCVWPWIWGVMVLVGVLAIFPEIVNILPKAFFGETLVK